MIKQKQCENTEISRFFFVELLKGKLFSGKDSTIARGNKLSSEHKNTVGSSVF